MPFFHHDGIGFNFSDEGLGRPFVFQHGLGGDASGPAAVFDPPWGWRRITLECRGHGQTLPLGDPEKLSMTSYADDLAALLDHLRLDGAVVGGISMGAAVALRFALRYPRRVAALVLSRPAWLDRPSPPNVAALVEIARLIRAFGPAEGKARFLASGTYREILAESCESARSLLGLFDYPRARETAEKFFRLADDAPCRQLEELRAIAVPTLVLVNRRDPIHPVTFGEVLARHIPGAVLVEITSKSVSPARHAADAQRIVAGFLEDACGRRNATEPVR